jgi:hypothetical protein
MSRYGDSEIINALAPLLFSFFHGPDVDDVVKARVPCNGQEYYYYKDPQGSVVAFADFAAESIHDTAEQ